MSKKHIFFWLLMPVLALMTVACGENDDEGSAEIDFEEVPNAQADVWVSGDNISEDDLTLYLDCMVKLDYIRVQFVKMLSNNFEGDELFCGNGPKSDPDPTMRTYTELMINADKYLAAVERLEAAGMMSPTNTTRSVFGNLQTIFGASKKENERAQELLLDHLNTLYKAGKYTNEAQQQLYNYYKEMSPEHAKQIGAKDARDFFKMLNNGELNSYASEIRHIWCDVSPGDDKAYEAVGDMNSIAATGHPEYLGAAYRVNSEVAVAVGELYFSGIDKFAGGYGAKIMEFGDYIETKVKLMNMAKKAVKGEVDWQEVNTFLVNHYADKIKDSVKGVFGDDVKGWQKDIFDDAVDKVFEDITGKLISEKASETDTSTEEGKKKVDDLVRNAGESIIEIHSIGVLFNENPRMILIFDHATGATFMGKPDVQGDITVTTFPGTKTFVFIDRDGNRLTKTITIEEGYNEVWLRPTIELSQNPVKMTAKGGTAKVEMTSNCRYFGYHITSPKPNWIDVKRSGKTLIITVKENNSSEPRSFKFKAVVSLGGVSVQASETVEVIQAGKNDKEPISTTPESLTFEAKGGQQNVKVNKGDYSYGGGFTGKDCEDWITITALSYESFIVKAAANPTDKERTGTIYAFATNTQNPTADDVVTVPITVTQKAGPVVENCWHLIRTDISKHDDTSGEKGNYMHYSASPTAITQEGKVVGAVGLYRDEYKLFDLCWNATMTEPPTMIKENEEVRIHVTIKRTTPPTIDEEYNNIATYMYPNVLCFWDYLKSWNEFSVENLEGPKGGPASYSKEDFSSWDWVYSFSGGSKGSEKKILLRICDCTIEWWYRWE